MKRFVIEFNGAQHVVLDKKGDVVVDWFKWKSSAVNLALHLNEEKGW